MIVLGPMGWWDTFRFRTAPVNLAHPQIIVLPNIAAYYGGGFDKTEMSGNTTRNFLGPGAAGSGRTEL